MGFAELKTGITEARVESIDLPEDGDWAMSARLAALGRVTDMGLPIKRDEYWKYTDPATFVAVDPVFTAASDEKASAFAALDRLRMVFVDGVFDAEASDDLSMTGVTIELLSDATQSDSHWAADVMGVLETAGQTPVERPLAALNTVFATTGVVIHATGQAAKPIEIAMQSTGADVMMHHLVQVDAGASVTILETGSAGARSNVVTEVMIADEGAFHHVKLQEDDARHALNHMFTRLGRESTFKSFIMTAGGKLTRNECVIELTGDDAAAHVAGACLGDGAFHHDDTVFITHDAVNCESRQVFKKVLRNGAVGVFQGKILVKPDAQKTDGYQISQSLLLDEDSQFLAKPELEIYADDVACSHGSTSGAIDEQALFYLRSRGVPHGTAVDLLTLSFMAEAIDEIDDADVAEAVLDYLTQGLEQRHG